MQRADGVKAEMSKLTSLTINSAVFAIKDGARPCIDADITDIKDCIRRGQNGLSRTRP